MKSIENYLDELKAKTGSDYKSAQAIGVDRSVITHMRKRGAMSDENAIKVAEILGIDPGEILISATLARSDGRVRDAWIELSKRAGIAASLALALVLTAGYSPKTEAAQFDDLYIMRSRKNRQNRPNACKQWVLTVKESILWHVRKAASIIPAGSVAV